jgi:ubiquinone/menaquinone biosynthesis C-methylase UbiE
MSSGLQASRENGVPIQRAYYAATAQRYDDMHGSETQNSLGLAFFLAVIDHLQVESVLDIGSGTGFVLRKLKEVRPGIAVLGIEPSSELREIGYEKGLLESELIEGDAMNLGLQTGSFDLVCEFAALHHIPKPSKAVSEMLRVARKAVFIADCNNFGQGSGLSRFLKQAINAVGLWRTADLIKTKGKGYTISEGDGLAYSYSVFDDYKQIAKACKAVHLLNNEGWGPNLYRTASSVSLVGIKQ